MNYKLLGKSGLRVSELALGTMTFGEEWGWGANKDESKRVFDMFSNAGGNFIDTAEQYSAPNKAETAGRSEEIIGSWLVKEKNRRKTISTRLVLLEMR